MSVVTTIKFKGDSNSSIQVTTEGIHASVGTIVDVLVRAKEGKNPEVDQIVIDLEDD
jgi:hypothetical protein